MGILDKVVEKKVRELIQKELIDKMYKLEELEDNSKYLLILPQMGDSEIEEISDALKNLIERKNLFVIIANDVSLIKLT